MGLDNSIRERIAAASPYLFPPEPVHHIFQITREPSEFQTDLNDQQHPFAFSEYDERK